MAESIITRTRRLTRDKLRQFLPNHEAMKVFEDLTHDVVVTLPDAISSQTDANALLALLGTDSHRSPTAAAQALADQIAVVLQTNRTQASAISALRRDVDDLQAQLLAFTRAQSSQLNALRKDIDDARTLIQGI